MKKDDLLKTGRFTPTNQKKPFLNEWQKQSLSFEEVRAKWPQNNIGFLTGNGIVVIDVDPKNGGVEEDVYKMGFPRGTYKVRSPSGGCHLYYQDPDNLFPTGLHNGEIGKGIDVQTNGQQIIVPPSVIDGKAYEVVDDLPLLVLYEMFLTLPLKKENKSPSLKEHSSSTREMIPTGQRNSTLHRKALSLLGEGYPKSAIEKLIFELNEVGCEDPLPEHEVRTLVDSAFTKPEENFTNLGKEDEVVLVSESQLIKTSGKAKTEFIWNKHIPKAMPVIIFGDGGIGKSTFALYVLNEIIEQNPGTTVLWAPVEGNLFDTREKLDELKVNPEHFYWLSRNGEYDFRFESEKDLDYLDRYMSKLKPSIVVIDSLKSMSRADINQNDIGEIMLEVQKIICTKHNATLVYLHHENKSGEMMGSTTIKAQVRVMLHLGASPEEGRQLVTAKSNIGDIEPLQFIRHKDGTFAIKVGLSNKSEEIRELLKKIFEKTDKKLIFECYREIQNSLSLEDDKMESVKAICRRVCKELNISPVQEGQKWFWIKGVK
jgi:hypothetical protein